ncbi:MAG: hypothetical protein AB7S64_05465 [Bacteroides sp.]
MKRYNLSEIMKDAHQFYRSKSRMGRSFGECLKLSWGWAKDAVKSKEDREAKVNVMVANYKPRESTSHIEGRLTWSDCYNVNNKGYLGSQYCGD